MKEAKLFFNKNKRWFLLTGLAIGGGYVMAAIKNNKDISKGNSAIDNKTKPTDGSNNQSRITKTMARNLAATLFNAMDRFGTDENAMFSAVQNLNGQELQEVFEAFGTPKYFAGTRGSIMGSHINLFGWFDNELSGSDLVRMKAIWNKSNLAWY